MGEVKYELVKNIKVLSSLGTKKRKEFNIVKWGSMEPSYDIRKWEEGKPKKGITLTQSEAAALFDAIDSEFRNRGAPK